MSNAVPVGILATGSYLPGQEVPNAELAGRAGVTEDWIVRKTNIRSRRFAAPEETTSDLAAAAGRAALDQIGLSPQDLDAIVVSTSTPDSPQPPTACRVQNLLGAWAAAAFDVNAVCTGFVYALEVARDWVAARPGAHVLVVAADLYSRILDFSDRRTAVLFGDGAGAAVVGPVEKDHGVLGIDLATRGDEHHLIRVEAGGSRLPASQETVEAGAHWFKMEGRLVREFVLDQVPPALTRLIKMTGVLPDEIAHVVPHQPNGKLLDELATLAGLANAHMHRTVDRYGNVGSASVPVTLDEAHRAGALHDGQLVLLTGFGGGMAVGSCLMRWQNARSLKSEIAS